MPATPPLSYCKRILALVVVSTALSALGFAQHYTRTDLTANIAAPGIKPDANLVNAWGLARGSGSPFWISDNGTGLTTLYDGTGAPQPLVVTIPGLNGQPSAPTGAVFNYSTGFKLVNGNAPFFIFVTEDGTVAGWHPSVGTTAENLKTRKNAIYKGVALAQNKFGVFLYATNFQTGRVDVYDSSMTPVHFDHDAFRLGDNDDHHRRRHDDDDDDDNIAPFGIQNVGGNLVVTYAVRQKGSKDEEHGAGLGFVAIFDSYGRRIARLQHGNWFNAPWGIALAPSDFGTFSHRLLIGNFGDGTVHAFNALTGKHEGSMVDAAGANIVIDGLWALSFGGGTARNGASTELFFTAGPNDENDGLFGKLTAVATDQRGNAE